jgi:DNA-binding transcriptional ArsR family regulator
MSVPLYQAKAELFRTLGHPMRIRVLELLQDGPKQVRELLADTGAEASSL